MKNKQLIIIGAVVVLLAVILTIAESMKPRPVNWEPTYSAREKIPFGLYVLDAEAPKLFEGDSVAKFWETPYEYFDKRYSHNAEQYTIKGSFIEISDANNLDTESAKELMNFATHGNTVMLSMKDFPPILLDTLNIEIDYQPVLANGVNITLGGNARERYSITNGLGSGYFKRLPGNDSIKILGHQTTGLKDLPNFIEAKFGHGRFILHTEPAVFTNYYLLKDQFYSYAQQALSAIPKGTVYWRNEYANNLYFEDPGSKLRFIMSQPGLKWAWRLGLYGLLIFILFNGRRRQRIVPEIPPVRNTTIDFAKTIGNLYYQEGDHHTIIEKKIIYFLEHIRTEYLIDTALPDDDFVEKLHLKTGNSTDDIAAAVKLVKKHRNNLHSTAEDVVAINKAIEKLRL